MTYNPYRPPNHNNGPKGGQAPDLARIGSVLAGDLLPAWEPKGPIGPNGPNGPSGPLGPQGEAVPAGELASPPGAGFSASQILNSTASLMGYGRGGAGQAAAQAEPVPPKAYDAGLYRDAFSRLGLMRLANVCDLGCGAGNFTGVMVSRNQKPEVYLGVDHSHAQISAARASYPGWNFIYGDFTQPKVREMYERYDAFLLLNVLDSIEDDLGLLSILPSGKPVLFSMPREPREESARFFASQGELKERYGNLLSFRSVGVYRAKDMAYSMAAAERW